MGVTSIEWTDRSINPLRARLKSDPSHVGHYCEKVSPGCLNCYASTLQKRWRMPEFGGTHGRGREAVEMFLDPKMLAEVLKRKIPTTWFWCDMTDMFGEWVPDEWIDACFAIMALTPQHTHQVLTKRADRLMAYTNSDGRAQRIVETAFAGAGLDAPRGSRLRLLIGDGLSERLEREKTEASWPISNVHLGVSVEARKHGLPRIDLLRQVPAALRFVSIEPLLEDLGEVDLSGIDWAILGFESGHRARPGNLNWMRSIIRQCRRVGTAPFVKQVGQRPYETAECFEQVGAEGALAALDTLHLKPVPKGWTEVHTPDGKSRLYRYHKLRHPKGGDPAEWPEDLRVREFPREMAHA